MKSYMFSWQLLYETFSIFIIRFNFETLENWNAFIANSFLLLLLKFESTSYRTQQRTDILKTTTSLKLELKKKVLNEIVDRKGEILSFSLCNSIQMDGNSNHILKTFSMLLRSLMRKKKKQKTVASCWKLAKMSCDI